jgi:signal transduction histidine kinase
MDVLPRYRGAFPQFWFSPRSAFLWSIAIILALFVADVVLPRGATVAIGYCVVPAVMAGRCSRRLLLGMMIFCTAATWLALFAELGGYEAWKSVFDRAMVTAAIWFSLFPILRRISARDELIQRDRALKETSLELERSNAELSSFTSVVAHDLRGPLNTIALSAHLLSTSPPLQADPDCVESVDSIQAEIVRMDDFVQSLLIYGRMGSGNLKRRDCDCQNVLDQVRRDLRADLQRSGAELSNDPMPLLQADATLLCQLFQNLIENAIKYRGPATPHIHVSATQQPQGWQFAVQDNGIGIRPQELDRIFEPFHQAGAGKSLGKGVGLGLATCRRIVERHGGQINVQSIPGAGTTFLFTIPSPPTMPATPPLPPETNPTKNIGSLLISEPLTPLQSPNPQ